MNWVSSCCGLPYSRPLAPEVLTATVANRPVARAPQVPPTPCTPTTSSASSTPKRCLTSCTPKKQMPPAPRPTMIAAGTLTKPAAGVIATRPATAPAAEPSTLGRRCTAADVDHCATREVERAQVVQPAAGAPYPVGDRVVHERRPQQAEQDERLEALALGEGAGDQGRRDDGEHHLERHVRQVGHCRRVVRVGVLADAVQPNPAQP